MNNVIVTLTGPSCSGKSTLERILCDTPGSVFERVISTTTRAPRPGEVDGSSYHFVPDDVFDSLSLNGRLMEHVVFGGNSYGATVEEFERIFKMNKIAVLVCEPIGRGQIEHAASSRGWFTLPVFLTNPHEVRFNRLMERVKEDFRQLYTREEGYHPAEEEKIARSHAKRFATIVSVEEHWEQDAHAYDMMFDAFNAQNQQAVVTSITAQALNLMARNPTANIWPQPIAME